MRRSRAVLAHDQGAQCLVCPQPVLVVWMDERPGARGPLPALRQLGAPVHLMDYSRNGFPAQAVQAAAAPAVAPAVPNLPLTPPSPPLPKATEGEADETGVGEEQEERRRGEMRSRRGVGEASQRGRDGGREGGREGEREAALTAPRWAPPPSPPPPRAPRWRARAAARPARPPCASRA